MKKGLLILSYNCNEPNWEETVWGTPPDRPGRLVKATAVLLEEDVDIAIISGGTGVKEGVGEAQWLKNRLYQGLEELKKFTIYPVLQRFTPEQIKNKLDKILVLEEKAVNTATNLKNTGIMFKEAGVEKVIVVTSPDHISRGLRDGLQFWSKEYPELAANLYGTASVTLYSNRTPEDQEIAKMENVVIAEPPTMKKFNFARMFGILNNPDALAEIDAILKKYSK